MTKYEKRKISRYERMLENVKLMEKYRKMEQACRKLDQSYPYLKDYNTKHKDSVLLPKVGYHKVLW